jgi:predicted RNA-binding Zn-ribbon protein involved in translation (DUF1610 family)
MRLQVFDYTSKVELSDAIERYFTLLRMTFDLTGIYKIFETCNSQIYQSISQANPPSVPIQRNVKAQVAHADFVCPKCVSKYKIQLNLVKNIKTEPSTVPFPENDIFVCPNCGTQTNIAPMRLQFEAQTGMKVVF